jgi:GNAT superfamily N-acetyltransferase
MTIASAPSGDIQLGRATPDEADAIAAVIRAAFEQYRGRLVPESGALAETGASIAACFADHEVLVARRGRSLVGCLLAKRTGGDVHLGRLAVLPAERGTGLGSRLIALAAEQAAAAGATTLSLRTRLALPENIRFYERLGFRVVGTWTHAGFGQPTASVMSRCLSSASPPAP